MNISSIVCQTTGASRAEKTETLQTLWSGYGHIYRFKLTGGPARSVVVKHVKYDHNRKREGLSDQRKRRSYHVETEWYRRWAQLCTKDCPVPHCYGIESNEDEVIMILEDLDAAGFALRLHNPSPKEIELCLEWLADFHARFLGDPPEGLWEKGTYWHLETRPEELDLLDDIQLKKAAPLIDKKLNETPFPTIVHGDAKLANFCLSRDRTRVAAVDFQYVGGGCGMKDLAYLGGSCFYYDQCEENIPFLLDSYFSYFRRALKKYGKKQNPQRVEENWRELFPYAWSDFHRFLKGWTPGRWNRDDYSERVSRQIAQECLRAARTD
ncbi:MAG: phosphotransferase [Spirochaetales bacterium]|nr:phosphotransferase [Spirochaetales bacterium]